MIKVIFLFRFRPDKDPEEVRRWWLNEHGELALKNRGIRRYVQNHFIAPLDPKRAAAGLGYDGCVEVWFEDHEAFERTIGSREWKAGEDDAPNGIEMSTLMGGFVNEHVMRWDADPDGRPYTSAEAPAS